MRNRVLSTLSLIALALIAIVPACKCSFTTAGLSDIQTFKDENRTTAASSFKTNDKIFARTSVTGNIGQASVKWRLLAKDIKGLPAQSHIPGIEAVKNIEGNSGLNFWATPPTNGWPTGKYTIEAVLVIDGDPKDTKTVDFNVEPQAAEKSPAAPSP